MRAPAKGDEITYRGQPFGMVVRTEGNLCWVAPFGGGETNPFIWKFKDGLNDLHDWPGKFVVGSLTCGVCGGTGMAGGLECRFCRQSQSPSEKHE